MGDSGHITERNHGPARPWPLRSVTVAGCPERRPAARALAFPGAAPRRAERDGPGHDSITIGGTAGASG